MEQSKERVLFDQLTRVPGFRDWIQHERETCIASLVSSSDIERIRNAQGAVRQLDKILAGLDAATKSRQIASQ